MNGGLRIAIVAVGKVKQAGLRAEIDDYLERIRRYAACDEIEIRDGKDAELSARFARALPARSTAVALEVGGREYTSAQLARFLEEQQRFAIGTLAFLVGGAYGLPEAVSRAAQQRLSLSKLTLPHRIARLVLAEQIYRAFTILRNEPYSH